jgi:hypothetical protein
MARKAHGAVIGFPQSRVAHIGRSVHTRTLTILRGPPPWFQIDATRALRT